MPTIFKGLTSITAWVLFLFGLFRLIIGLVYAFSSGSAHPEIPVYLDFTIGISSLFLAVVVIRLRKSLE